MSYKAQCSCLYAKDSWQAKRYKTSSDVEAKGYILDWSGSCLERKAIMVLLLSLWAMRLLLESLGEDLFSMVV